MQKNNRFLSLKWKFAFGFGAILILLYGLFSYYAYREAEDNFAHSRVVAQENQINVARALTQDSFFVLERFVESLVVVHEKSEQKVLSVVQLFDEHWNHWQMIWGLENATFYDEQGKLIRQWGGEIQTSQASIQRAYFEEKPIHQIICKNGCFQLVLTPVLMDSNVIGVLATSLSLSDTLLSYESAIHSDIGVIIDEQKTRFSAVTHAARNLDLWRQVRSKYELKTFFTQALNFKVNQNHYEIRAFSISLEGEAPYYIIINNVTDDYKRLQKKFSSLAVTGLVGLLIALLLLILNVHFILARVTQLSRAFPLLVQHQYHLFRSKVSHSKKLFFADEVEQLTLSALQAVSELEDLQTDVKNNTTLLVKRTSELKEERDFIAQLIDTAPIIIITQNARGEVLTINQEGIKELHMNVSEIVGKEFSDLIPATEIDHLQKLMELRVYRKQLEINYSGCLNLCSGHIIYIDWIHTIFREDKVDKEPIILSLGVDVTERHLADEQLIWTATHDQLTGLSNRRFFQTELDSMLAAAERYHEKVALFYLDLDQFKVINDTYGHQAGDELLQSITDILVSATRETDLLSRIGGDEFALVIPAATTIGVKQLATKLIQALKVFDYSIKEQSHAVSFSIGVAIYPEHGKTQLELLANADLAMYHAKQTGRSRYHIFSPDFEYQMVLTEQLRWKHIIEQGIEDDRFVLFYQPILDIKHKRISHYECLLRLYGVDGELMMPGDFIHHAEETGIIDQLDRLVIKKAIEQHLLFQESGNDAMLAINLSGRSMSKMEILHYIEELLSLPNVKPELMIFEITETSAVSNFLSAKAMITKLNTLGCHFALDDFGVGFSSFYYLKSLPVDYVKIDGSFIRQMDVSEEDRVFVKVLTEVSQTFGKKIIAEYVENQEILELLELQGVDYAQGFYISVPLKDPLDLSDVKGLA